MRVLLVHNPEAGDDNHERDQLVRLLSSAGHEVEYQASESHHTGALLHEWDLVVVAGGDGTVSDVAKATAGRNVPMTILPAGTANNIAETLGLTGFPHEVLVEGWTGGTLRPFDLGLARGPWGSFEFLESVGVGALADMMLDIEHGRSGYVNTLEGRHARMSAAFDVLHRIVEHAAPVHCELEMDDRRISGDYLLVEVLNFGIAGPNLHLAPRADGSDGRLDVVLVDADSRITLQRHLAAVQHDPLSSDLLQVHHARRVSIRYHHASLHLDDELWRRPATGIGAELSVLSGALTFLVPRVNSGGRGGSVPAP